MKAIRFLWFIAAIVSVLNLCAQSTVQMPTMNMRSTSSMIYSGSTLPQAAATGVILTIDQVSSPSPRNVCVRKSLDDGDDDIGGGTIGQPFPLGDVVWPLMLLALGYVGVRVVRRKKRNEL